MPSMLPEQKLLKHLADTCADSRLNEVFVAHAMGRQPQEVQARFYNILVSYIYSMAHYYEIGSFPNDTYDICRVSKKIKDLALSDEYVVEKYPVYGDYEAVDLTGFDIR